MEESIRKADILIEALPYIQAFRGKVIVAKYSGNAIDDPVALRSILQDLVFLSAVGIRAVLVHGGGRAITQELSAAGHKSSFIEGLRVTDRATVRLVNHALEGVNQRLIEKIRVLNGHAEGIVARHRVILAEPHSRTAQLGFVGNVRGVHTSALRAIFTRHAIPVVSPVGTCEGQLYNINADSVASAVAAHLKAEKLVLLTNVRGILGQPNDVESLIPTLSIREARLLVERRIIQEGMIPKVKACIEALRRGVKKTHIIDASIPHAMLLEIFTKQGIGTELVR